MTAAARIREAAMRLFAERGVAAVSVRGVADVAEVSSSLVIHHHESEKGPKAAVGERAASTLVEVLAKTFDAGPPHAGAPPLASRITGTLAADVLRCDPLGAEGVTRWTDAAMELYGPGLFTPEAGA